MATILQLAIIVGERTVGIRHIDSAEYQIGVIMLLLLNSTAGVIISFVYKYGDAVLKTLAQPISSSLLVFISCVFFDLSLDIVKASGAGVVILSTLLYIDLPLQNSNEDSTTS